MTPVVGDRVLFTFEARRRDEIGMHASGALNKLGQSTTVPAVVVAVFSDTVVNLRVHPDGPGPDLWETSVVLRNLMDEPAEKNRYWEWPLVT